MSAAILLLTLTSPRLRSKTTQSSVPLTATSIASRACASLTPSLDLPRDHQQTRAEREPREESVDGEDGAHDIDERARAADTCDRPKRSVFADSAARAAFVHRKQKERVV